MRRQYRFLAIVPHPPNACSARSRYQGSWLPNVVRAATRILCFSCLGNCCSHERVETPLLRITPERTYTIFCIRAANKNSALSWKVK